MSILLYVFLCVCVLACVAMLGTQGIWTSLIALFNVLTAIVLALNFFEPAATWLDSQAPSYSYLLDFIALWGLFVVFVSIFGLLTGFFSQVQVRFHRLADIVGGVLISLWVGWLLVSFTLLSLHVAPLPRNSFGGTFQPTPESRMVFGLGPDRKLLAFMHMISRGAFRQTPPAEQPQQYVFDPDGDFILTYGARRAIFETTRDLRVNREFGSGILEKGPVIIEE